MLITNSFNCKSYYSNCRSLFKIIKETDNCKKIELEIWTEPQLFQIVDIVPFDKNWELDY